MRLMRYNLLFVLLLMLSCGKNEETMECGYLTISDPATGQTKAAVSVDKFTVTIRRENGETAFSAERSQYPQRLELMPGGYYLDVQYPSNDNYKQAAFDQPLYKGKSSDFVIESGKTTVGESVLCTLSNMKVTLSFDNSIKDNYTNYSATVSISDAYQLIFNANESREGWFEPLPLKVKFSGTRKDDSSFEQREFTVTNDIEKGFHHKINISIK